MWDDGDQITTREVIGADNEDFLVAVARYVRLWKDQGWVTPAHILFTQPREELDAGRLPAPGPSNNKNITEIV